MLAVKGRYNGATVVFDSTVLDSIPPFKECDVIVNFPDIPVSVKPPVAGGSLQLEDDQLEEDQIKEEIAEEHKRLWDKWVGETLYFGDIPDYMLLTFLFKKFYKLGLNFFEGRPNYYVSDDVNKISTGADFMMRNDDKQMLVKMKKELTTEDVKDHIDRLEKMRKYADLHGDSGLKSVRTFLGAVAGVVVTYEAKDYALNQGFYVIEPSGVSFSITSPLKPKEW